MFFTIGNGRRATNAQLSREAEMVLELVSVQEETSPAVYDIQTMVHQRFREIESRQGKRPGPVPSDEQTSDQVGIEAQPAPRPLGMSGNLAAGRMALRAIVSAIIAVVLIVLLGTFLVNTLASV